MVPNSKFTWSKSIMYASKIYEFFLLTAVFFYDVIEYRLLYRTQPLNLIFLWLLNSSWYEKSFLLHVLLNEKYKSYLWQTFIANSWTQISVAKNSVKSCSQMRLTGLIISETGQDWFQETLAQFFPISDTGTIVPRWAGLIVFKWHWHNYS